MEFVTWGELQDTMEAAGAKVSDEGIIETFDNDDEALDAVDNGVAVSIYFDYMIYLCRKWLFACIVFMNFYVF